MAPATFVFLILAWTIKEKKAFYFIGLTGFIHPGLSIGIPLGLLFLGMYWIFSKGLSSRFNWFKNRIDQLQLSIADIIITGVISVMPFVLYGIADGRMTGGPSQDHLGLMELGYLILHTFLRSVISTFWLFPLFLGWFFLMKRHEGKTVMLICVTLGVLLSFSIAEVLIGGNSIQLFFMGISVFVVPIGLWGLLTYNAFKRSIKYLKIGLLGIYIIMGGFLFVQSSFYLNFKQWDKSKSGQDLAVFEHRNYLPITTLNTLDNLFPNGFKAIYEALKNLFHWV